MIKITVRLENDFDTSFQEVEITKEELYQLACNNAKGMFKEGYWHNIQPQSGIKIEIK